MGCDYVFGRSNQCKVYKHSQSRVASKMKWTLLPSHDKVRKDIVRSLRAAFESGDTSVPFQETWVHEVHVDITQSLCRFFITLNVSGQVLCTPSTKSMTSAVDAANSLLRLVRRTCCVCHAQRHDEIMCLCERSISMAMRRLPSGTVNSRS